MNTPSAPRRIARRDDPAPLLEHGTMFLPCPAGGKRYRPQAQSALKLAPTEPRALYLTAVLAERRGDDEGHGGLVGVVLGVGEADDGVGGRGTRRVRRAKLGLAPSFIKA